MPISRSRRYSQLNDEKLKNASNQNDKNSTLFWFENEGIPPCRSRRHSQLHRDAAAHQHHLNAVTAQHVDKKINPQHASIFIPTSVPVDEVLPFVAIDIDVEDNGDQVGEVLPFVAIDIDVEDNGDQTDEKSANQLPPVDKVNPYRLVKASGVKSSPRPVYPIVTGFPPPIPEEYQDRTWPIQEGREHVSIFVPTVVPVGEVLPFVAIDIDVEDNGDQVGEVLPFVAIDIDVEDNGDQTDEKSANQLPPVDKVNPYRLVKANGVKSSPRPVYPMVTGFPPPIPQEYQERNWPSQERSERVSIFVPTVVPVGEVLPFVAIDIDVEDNGDQVGEVLPFVAIDIDVEDNEDQVGEVLPFVAIDIDVEDNEDQTDEKSANQLPPVDKVNPYRLVKASGVKSSPRPVYPMVTGFPPPIPEEYQDRSWPSHEGSEHVSIFVPTVVPVGEVLPFVAIDIDVDDNEDQTFEQSANQHHPAVTGFPTSILSLDGNEFMTVFIPTFVSVEEIPPSVAFDEQPASGQCDQRHLDNCQDLPSSRSTTKSPPQCQVVTRIIDAEESVNWPGIPDLCLEDWPITIQQPSLKRILGLETWSDIFF
ncbi:uncharacterized protein LOC130699346 isoform X1 [Daphnia carinata]|uniref:uncharacterized protein LOC130699346 isoform X1 n=1 Tax=Daphnia carinata TaxID=120202 RepID=UPI00257EA368|nr:uncharacterized protein LOC130699346 isoform X1 [Daphnia carinata]